MPDPVGPSQIPLSPPGRPGPRITTGKSPAPPGSVEGPCSQFHFHQEKRLAQILGVPPALLPAISDGWWGPDSTPTWEAVRAVRGLNHLSHFIFEENKVKRGGRTRPQFPSILDMGPSLWMCVCVRARARVCACACVKSPGDRAVGHGMAGLLAEYVSACPEAQRMSCFPWE